MTKHSGWSEHADGSLTAKIGRYEVEIFPPQKWSFWRGDHKGIPCHIGPGVSRTIIYRGSHCGTAFTIEGAKRQAKWTVENDMTGFPPPDSIMPQEELDVLELWNQTVQFVNDTYGDA